MPNRLQVHNHASLEQLQARLKATSDKIESQRLLAIIHFSKGESARSIASSLHTKPDWVRRTVRRYNQFGQEGLINRQGQHQGPRAVPREKLPALLNAVMNENPPGGGMWTGKKVQRYLLEKHQISVSNSTTHRTMHEAGLRKLVPRPAHPEADPEAREHFKKKSSPNSLMS